MIGKDSKVIIIGSGNVATVLGKMIVKAGYTVKEIISRNINAGEELAIKLGAKAVHDFSLISSSADIYIIAVADDAVESVAGQLPAYLKSKLIVHTTGSLSKDVLKNVTEQYGVLYPLQSLKKESLIIPEVPLYIDGSTQAALDRLRVFASDLSDKVDTANDEQRLKLHIAAVITSNFTNHLYALAEQFCNKENIRFENLLPLIEETVNRMKLSSPAQMQTGPASRGDVTTINKHLEMLEQYPQIRNIYKLLSESIIKKDL